MTDQNSWYSDGLKFTCQRCGHCCGGAPGYVWVDTSEIRLIAKELGIPFEAFKQKRTRVQGNRRSLLEYANGDCEFLVRDKNGKAGCKIHNVRPLQCRTWPFWVSNLETNESWRLQAHHCPGMDTGSYHPFKFIEEQKHAGASRPL